MRTYPTRKRYIYELTTIHGSVLLKFSQATSNEALNEYNNLKSMDEKTFSNWYMKTLKTWTIGYKKRRFVPNIALWIVIKQDIFKIYHEIASLRYKKWEGLYKDLPEVKPEKYRKRALFNTDMFLAEKCNCRIDEVRDILTDEQIGFLLDDARWDYYESFDKGKSINDDILVEKGWTLSQQEEELKQYMDDYEKRREEYKKQGLLSNK